MIVIYFKNRTYIFYITLSFYINKIKIVDPPFIESVANLFSSKHMKIHSKSRASLINLSASKQPLSQSTKLNEKISEQPEKDETHNHNEPEVAISNQNELGTANPEYFSFSPLEKKKTSIYESNHEKPERYFYMDNSKFDSFSFSNEKPDYRNLETFGSIEKNDGFGSRESSPEEIPPAV
jgi:hypothetical protein